MFWESIVDDTVNSDIAMDCTSYPTKNGLSLSGRSKAEAPLGLNEMAVDDLCFYSDDVDMQQEQFIACPQLMGLLSPETSPQRFQIVERNSDGTQTTTFLSPMLCQQKLSRPTVNAGNGDHQTTITTNNTNNNNSNSNGSNSNNMLGSTASSNFNSEKGFRVFHSQSSSGVESSTEDDYLELFDMESLEEQIGASSNSNFPTNLNSLISGQIMHASPIVVLRQSSSPAMPASAAATATATPTPTPPTIVTPEMRRPSARRCLSLTDSNQQQQQQQQQQPKTPDFLKRIQDATGCLTPLITATKYHSPTTTTAMAAAATTPTSSSCFKRPEPPAVADSPILKRVRPDEKENVNTIFDSPLSRQYNNNNNSNSNGHGNAMPINARPLLRKSMSMNDAEILSAMARSENKDEPDLIGDFSRPFALPLMEGRHRDLKSVSSDTVARLLRGEFNNLINNYRIVDCRYPYEFEGGHIRGALNLYTQEQIAKHFPLDQKTEFLSHCDNTGVRGGAGTGGGGGGGAMEQSGTVGNKRNIIVFHCEFSSERGPKLSRFLRNSDRARNTSSYPALDYPEIYLLHNGYKEFFETHSDLCDPVAYRPMLEPSYSEAYRHFRAKSKSWNGGFGGSGSCLSYGGVGSGGGGGCGVGVGAGGGGGTGRMKKSRSRLLM